MTYHALVARASCLPEESRREFATNILLIAAGVRPACYLYQPPIDVSDLTDVECSSFSHRCAPAGSRAVEFHFSFYFRPDTGPPPFFEEMRAGRAPESIPDFSRQIGAYLGYYDPAPPRSLGGAAWTIHWLLVARRAPDSAALGTLWIETLRPATAAVLPTSAVLTRVVAANAALLAAGAGALSVSASLRPRPGPPSVA